MRLVLAGCRGENFFAIVLALDDIFPFPVAADLDRISVDCALPLGAHRSQPEATAITITRNTAAASFLTFIVPSLDRVLITLWLRSYTISTGGAK